MIVQVPSASLDFERLARAKEAYGRATAGEWWWNCAGEVFALVEEAEVCIGNFNGCESDAAAVCRLHNNAAQLFEIVASSHAKLVRPSSE